MISIKLNRREFEHDTYDLIKAYYPEEKLIVTEDGIIDINGMKKANRLAMEDELLYTFLIAVNEESIQLDIRREEGSIYQKQERFLTQEKKQNRNQYKRFIYHALSEMTGRELPWGTLTGVRPTKIVLNQLEAGEEESVIRDYMKQEYLCSDEKIAVSLQIAKRELEILNQCDYKNGYSIYIGIPFCPTICNYCSFASYSLEKHENILGQYLDALEKEMVYASTCLSEKKLTTLYVGGGTPTSLDEEQLERLMIMIKKYFDFSHMQEFTVEAGRPDSITRGKLQILKKYGVDRISINPQSMRQKTLDFIGRKHSVEQILQCYEMAREEGHDNINMDIILGLSGETIDDVAYTLEEIGKLAPDSLTVHTLAMKRAADLTVNKDKYKGYKATRVSDMLDLSIEFAQQHGYEPYYLYRQKNMAENLENTGYSKLGKEGIYNILIMEEKQTILALGAGALSKFVFHQENRIERVENVKSIRDYMERTDEMIERKRKFVEKNREIL